MAFNAGLGMAGSYYAATARPWTPQPPLAGEIDADLVIVGAGCTGLSAALEAAERGWRVVVLEGGRAGWGASGRNGGQIIPGLRKGAAELVDAFGEGRARSLFDLAVSARDLVEARIRRHAIVCDFKPTGHLLGAVKPAHFAEFAAEAECLARVMNYHDVEVLSAKAAREEVDAPYFGALRDRRGGHFHPLNYALGLADAALAARVRIFEGSPAVALKTGRKARVETLEGAVTAERVLLAGDAFLKGVSRPVETHIMPVASYVAATVPLANPASLIPHDVAVSDSRFVVNYYRLTADGRLLFGGGERYTPTPPADIAAFVRPHIEGVFPALRGLGIDHAWGGLVSITRSRLPHLGRAGDVFFAHGYSGMGAILSTLGGKLTVDAMAGENEAFDLLAGVAPPAFPGGVALRGPLHLAGMLWYVLRDRL
jgi:gamma-glutamylputrescine oxidase